MDEEVYLDSTEEAECLVGWSFKFILMDLQREIFFKIHTLKRKREQKSPYFLGGFKFLASEARNKFDITALTVHRE